MTTEQVIDYMKKNGGLEEGGAGQRYYPSMPIAFYVQSEGALLPNILWLSIIDMDDLVRPFAWKRYFSSKAPAVGVQWPPIHKFKVIAPVNDLLKGLK